MKHPLFVILIILVACNSSSEKATPIKIGNSIDSITESFDTTTRNVNAIDDKLDTLASFYIDTRSQVQELRNEKRDLIQQLEQKYPNYQSIQSDDPHLARINELNSKLAEKEFIITRLRNQIKRDSISHSKPTIGNKLRKIIEDDYILPDNNSLVINLNGPDIGTSVWVMPYSKQAKKAMKEYDLFCNESKQKFKEFEAKEALCYNGKYFVNSLPAGKYIIKICAYYGNYTVVNKENGFTEVNLPVQ